MHTSLPPSKVTKLSFWSQKMCNVLKCMQKQFFVQQSFHFKFQGIKNFHEIFSKKDGQGACFFFSLQAFQCTGLAKESIVFPKNIFEIKSKKCMENYVPYSLMYDLFSKNLEMHKTSVFLQSIR